MSAAEFYPTFDYLPVKSIYDDDSKNEYDTVFAEMPPTTETFIELAQKLGYQENEHIAINRIACMKTDYENTENVSEAQGIATFERLCAEAASGYEGTAERLMIRRGLRLSEASVYFHFGQYYACIDQLRTVFDDVCHETAEETEQCQEVSALIRHLSKVQIGHEAVANTMRATT
jgi:hypothetical protein